MPRYAKDPTAFIILNPHAAKGRAASFKDQIASYFAKEQYSMYKSRSFYGFP